MKPSPIPTEPRILTTTVGSYPVPDWLSALPSEQAVIDATRVIFDTQRQSGIDLPTDGELYRFDVNHPDTNGMIDYFVGSMGGIDTCVGRSDLEAFRAKQEMGFRAKPAGIVRSALAEGALNLLDYCQRAADLAGGDFKFTVTSPYMLARTLPTVKVVNFCWNLPEGWVLFENTSDRINDRFRTLVRNSFGIGLEPFSPLDFLVDSPELVDPLAAAGMTIMSGGGR